MFVQSTTGSAWRQIENWRAKQKQFTADFEAFNNNFSARLTDAFSLTNDGLFQITVRKAVAAAQQRASERAKLNQVDRSV